MSIERTLSGGDRTILRLGIGGHSPIMLPVSHSSTDRMELGVSATEPRENSRGKASDVVTDGRQRFFAVWSENRNTARLSRPQMKLLSTKPENQNPTFVARNSGGAQDGCEVNSRA